MEGQREHWNDVYSNNESYFGTEMSPFGKMSLEFLKGKDVKDVLELGPGQGRDSLGFVMNGYNLTGLDCSNVASYEWVTDYGNRQYAVENSLTGRRFNVKLSVNF